jgi:hypothetical protein
MLMSLISSKEINLNMKQLDWLKLDTIKHTYEIKRSV